MNVPTSKFCQAADCSFGGTYNPEASTTNEFVSHDFNVTYLDNRPSTSGDFVTDSLHLAGQELKDTQFGLGLQSPGATGLIGLGYLEREQITLDTGELTYANLPQLLKDADLINTVAYSIWLNDRKASFGTLLFGGIDTAKFHGNLTTLPAFSRADDFTFFTNLTGLGFTSQTKVSSKFGSGTSTLPVRLLLDTGANLITLPEDIAREVFATLRVTPGVLSNDDRITLIACSRAQEESTLDFTFGSAKISVPLSELVLPLDPDQFGNPKVTDGSRPLCRLAVTFPAKPTDTLILGNAFLRSAYLLFDLENHKISIAPTNFDTAFTNVVEIGSPSQ